MVSHLVISDAQIKPSTNVEFCSWFGKLIMDRRPDKVIVMGDWWDMPSLSKWDKGLKSVGRNVSEDINAGITGMTVMFKPWWNHIKKMKAQKKKWYKPDLYFCMGNHEERIERFVNDNPILAGTLGYESLRLERMGFDVRGFLDPLKLDGIQYIHYVKNKNSDYPKASAKATIEQTFMSTIQGHKPGLDVYTVWSDRTGRNAWSIVNGSSYVEDESYRRGGGNDHWRGVMFLDNVVDGDFDPEFISMEGLKRKYG